MTFVKKCAIIVNREVMGRLEIVVFWCSRRRFGGCCKSNANAPKLIGRSLLTLASFLTVFVVFERFLLVFGGE